MAPSPVGPERTNSRNLLCPLSLAKPSMKTYRPTFVLIGLFFTGLLALWWLDYAGVPTEAQRRQRGDRVLADLVGTPELGITALEIDARGQTVNFERQGRDRWQMTRPLDVAAD